MPWLMSPEAAARQLLLSIRDVGMADRRVTDPGGMFEPHSWGTSRNLVPQLAEIIGAKRGDLDPAAVVEFLDLGKVYEGRTLHPEIRASARHGIRIAPGPGSRHARPAHADD